MTTVVLSTRIDGAENKVPDLSGSVKKTDYDAKTKYIKGKYSTIADYNKCTSNILDAKMTKKFVNKSDFSNLIKNSELNTKLEKLATKDN